MTAAAVLEDTHAVATIIGLAHVLPEFTADDVAREMRRPPHSNLPGIAFTTAKRAGHIEPTGYQTSSAPSRKHGVQRSVAPESQRRNQLMKFKTIDLIARIDDLIADRVKLATEKHAEDVAAYESRRAQWLEDHSAAYIEFANRVKEKLRKGRPIGKDDIPDGAIGRYREFATFEQGKAPAKREAKLDDLHTLKTALLAVSDEYVTTTGLREVGFKDIARLFRGSES